MNLEIDGETIDSVTLDYAVTLATSDNSEIRIESPFLVHSQAGQVVEVNPEQVGTGAEQVASLLHVRISKCEALDSGALILELDNGTRVTVESDASYEAWTFAATNGRKVIAQPSGGLMTWAPNE